ncbi:MAG: LptF/LptG family permease [Rikenellaceae bacterium]|jgi:lipopolysaccharide export system permease protein|nr:LptF/LptG family permease [Rikenellaceae bacterium]
MKKLSRRLAGASGLKILDLYIIGKFLGTFLFALGLIVIIIVIFDAAEKIDDFTELKAPLSKIIFQYYFNFVPFLINQFSGLLTFIAVIFFTSKLAYRTEIIAMLSGGVSFRRLMWPYMISATAIVSLSLLLNLVVIPAANVKRVDFESKYLKMFQNGQSSSHIYRQIEQGIFVYIRGYSRLERRAEFLAIERYDGNVLAASCDASDAVFNPETSHWSAPKYLLRQFDSLGRETFERRERLDTLINLQAEELGRVEELVKTMDIATLNRFIAQQRAKGSDMIDQFEVERQARYTFPMASFILTLMGVSLSSRKVRGGTGLHIGLGIGLCASYILISRFAEEFAKGGLLPPYISMWIPNLIYLAIAIYLYRKAPK